MRVAKRCAKRRQVMRNPLIGMWEPSTDECIPKIGRIVSPAVAHRLTVKMRVKHLAMPIRSERA